MRPPGFPRRRSCPLAHVRASTAARSPIWLTWQKSASSPVSIGGAHVEEEVRAFDAADQDLAHLPWLRAPRPAARGSSADPAGCGIHRRQRRLAGGEVVRMADEGIPSVRRSGSGRSRGPAGSGGSAARCPGGDRGWGEIAVRVAQVHDLRRRAVSRGALLGARGWRSAGRASPPDPRSPCRHRWSRRSRRASRAPSAGNRRTPRRTRRRRDG